MATPQRRSLRLRSQTPQQESMAPNATPKLSTLTEREETPERSQLNLGTLAASAPPKRSTTTLPAQPFTTPTASSRIQPSPQEMHPSRYQSANKKLMLSGKRVKLESGKAPETTSPTVGGPAKNEADSAKAKAENTSAGGNPFISPGFEFAFKRPSTELSSEAKKMMEEVREQASKIKVELTAQKDTTSEEYFGNESHPRKLAKAKGKMGRFSEVHMEQFKKMNSIADYSSSFRRDTSKIAYLPKSLKRSNTTAGLEISENVPPLAQGNTVAPGTRELSSPVKRFKRRHEETAADTLKQATPTIPHSKSALTLPNSTSTIATPTKASLLRATSSKALGSGVSPSPGLLRSRPARRLFTPQPMKTSNSINDDKKAQTSFASKMTNVKSILRRPHFLFSNDPLKLAAGTHVSTPSACNISSDKVLPGLPRSSAISPSYRKEKHVNFHFSPDAGTEESQAVSPSPTKGQVIYPLLASPVHYPLLSPTANGTIQGKAADDNANDKTPSRGPHDFTFRIGQAISFAPGPTPTTPTIRRVRENEYHALDENTTKSLSDFPTVAHGLSNKKRKRDSSENEPKDNKENEFAASEKAPEGITEEESPTKKVKTMSAVTESQPRATPGKLTKPSTKGKQMGKSKAKGILTINRLNALAQPKRRG